MVEVINVRGYSRGLKEAIEYIHGVWGSNKNYSFYKDAIEHSTLQENALPQFYIMVKEHRIVGCVALIINDFISRHDLFPWMACLFVEESERGNGYGKKLIRYAEKQAKKSGYMKIYLTTDHSNLYERYGWVRMEDGIDLFSGGPTRIYYKEL